MVLSNKPWSVTWFVIWKSRIRCVSESTAVCGLYATAKPFLFFISFASASVIDNCDTPVSSINFWYSKYLARRSWTSFSFASSSSLVNSPGISSDSSCLSISLSIRRYSSVCPFSHLIRSSSLFFVKLLSFELLAWIFVPSTDVNPHSTAPEIRRLNSWKISLRLSILSFLKSEMVRKSGSTPPVIHFTSRFTLQLSASFREERIPFLLP